MLPNVSRAECEARDGTRFDFVLHPPLPGLVAGANLTVYNDDLHGSHFLHIQDFELSPVGSDEDNDDYHEHVDVKYTGESNFTMGMYGKQSSRWLGEGG
jgi:hypothetical protein